VSFSVTFADTYKDSFLMVVVDTDKLINESDESNNDLKFAGGIFIAHESETRQVLHIVGVDNMEGGNAGADSATAAINGSTLQVALNGASRD
jgi:hypothetical protein